MSFTIIALSPTEKFLQFLDSELCDITETHEYGGLRTVEFEYTFQDLAKDKALFKLGNKIWIQGHPTIEDCLYVVNTEVKQDIFKENKISFEAEEVLVELNNAPLFSHTELTQANGFNVTGDEVTIDWNALNYWFGDYFNIRLVQKCISDYASVISLTGTMTRMNLLRQIEEETGNVFVTKYEKDQLNNTIHRYLDFVNPININKDWTLYTEYSFINNNVVSECYDENGNLTTEDEPYEATPFWNPDYENLDEDSNLENETKGTEGTYERKVETEEYDPEKDYTPLTNINPDNIVFRIQTEDNIQLLNENDEELIWTAEQVGFTDDITHVVIKLIKEKNTLAVEINEKSFVLVGSTDTESPSGGFITIANDPENDCVYPAVIPDDCYFEIYDQVADVVVYRTHVNHEIGHVHSEVLDFGLNVENVELNVDESNTYTAVSPVLSLSENNNSNLNRTDLGKVISNWRNLKITKGQVVPMIVEKITVTATSLAAAKSSLGTYSLSNNYWVRPLKPNDNTDSEDKQFEFYRATAYWKAPYTKNKGELHVSTDNIGNTEYTTIYSRNDTRDEKGAVISPKMGTTESTDEDVYAIYNQVALYLREHETPEIDVQVDIANLKNHEFVNYNLHDKVYIKLPDSQELVTARIINTVKDAHDIAKNTITLSNYTSLNTIKTITKDTHIEADNLTMTYPRTKNLTATLVNSDYDNMDEDDIEFLPLKLISFTLYKVENGSATFTGKVYTKKTDAYGKATITLQLDPGDYEIDINYAGDEIYTDSNLTILVNVNGTKEVVAQMTKAATKSKTTKKTAKKTKTVKTYWTKCGLSPDKNHKEIVAVAQPSASNSDAKKYDVSMSKLYRTVFKNKCPECGRTGTLRFDGGAKNKCITSAGARGRGYKINVPEHEITCIHCDSDFDGVTGLEKDSNHSTRLKMVKKPVKSSKSEFAKLVKGQLLYSTKKVTVSSKANTNTRSSRKQRKKSISPTIKKLAVSIVGDSVGLAAIKKICTWMDHNISYAKYKNFVRSPEQVYKHKSANCCDGTRFFFEVADAAGCCEYFDLYYVHVQCPKFGHVYGYVKTKKTGKWRYVDHASDSHIAWGYVIRSCPKGKPKSKYPNLPF